MLVGQSVAADKEVGHTRSGDGLIGSEWLLQIPILKHFKKHLDGVLAEGIADHLNVVNVDNIDGCRLNVEERVIPYLKSR